MRDAERDALQRLAEIREQAREAARAVSDLAVILPADDAARVATLAALHLDADEINLDSVAKELRSATLHDDPAGRYFWSNVARRRLEATKPGINDPRYPYPAERRLRHDVGLLVNAATDDLRDLHGDAALEAATGLASVAGNVLAHIESARSRRGEGRFQIHSDRRTVKITGAPIYDASGYAEVPAVVP